MSKNPLIALQEKKATDLVGGDLNMAIIICLQNLTDLSHQISRPNSRAFQVKKDTVRATPGLYALYGAANQINSMNSNNSFPYELLDDNPNLKVLIGTQLLMRKIINMISQNIYFDPTTLDMTLNQHPYGAQLCIFLDQMWNEIRGFSSSRQAINNLTFHNRLVQTQCTENSRIVSRLLRAHERINVTKLSYLFILDKNNQTYETCIIERGLLHLKADLIGEIQRLNPDHLFCTQWRIQRTLYGQYYLNIFIYHDESDTSLHIPQDNLSRQLKDKNDHLIQLTLSNPVTGNLKISKNGFLECSLSDWKAFFKIMVSPLKYYHYQSSVILPKFDSIIY